MRVQSRTTSRVGERPQAAHETARPSDETSARVARGPRGELLDEVAVVSAQVRVLGRAGGHLGDEFESLEQPRRQHGPQHQSRRRQVVVGDPACERQAERRQQRPVGADPVDDRLGRRPRPRSGRLAEDDPQRLAPAELDEDGLARLEIAERAGTGYVYVRAPPRRRHRWRPRRARVAPAASAVRSATRLERHGPSPRRGPGARDAPVLVRDDRLDPLRGPLDLARLVGDHVVVVLLAGQLEGRVALAQFELVGGLGRARPQALEERLERRRDDEDQERLGDLVLDGGRPARRS